MNQRDGFSRLVQQLGSGVATGESIERPIDSLPLDRVGEVALIRSVEDPALGLLDVTPRADQLPALCWNYSMDDLGRASQDGILEEFVRLKGADADRYLAFAQRFGPLMTCEHGMPPLHQLMDKQRGLNLGACRSSRLEPLHMWRSYVDIYSAILTLAALVEESGRRWTRRRAELWQQTLLWTRRDDVPWWVPSERADRRMLLLTLEYWLAATGVGPRLRHQDKSLRILLGGGGVLGALTLQTTLAVARSKGLAFCSECVMAYVPKKRPDPNRRNYCQSCRDQGIPNRDAQRAWRARQRAKAAQA